MNPTRCLSTAPLTLASAVAARTQRIKVGTAVQVLPLSHPLRLAEETATIDQISGGRLVFGVGRSAFPRAYDAYGISYQESQDRFSESLDIIKMAWTQPVASHSGRYWNFENFTLVPQPVQRPHPPIRIAASQPDTYAAIGKLGYPLFAAMRASPMDENLGEYPGALRDAWQGVAGHPGRGEAYLFRCRFILPRRANRRLPGRPGWNDAVRYLPGGFIAGTADRKRRHCNKRHRWHARCGRRERIAELQERRSVASMVYLQKSMSAVC